MDHPTPPVLALIRQAGFGGLIDLPFMSLDLALMTALMERWGSRLTRFTWAQASGLLHCKTWRFCLGYLLMLPVGYTNEDVRRQARGYILQLIGGILLPDHSRSHVHLAYLTLLEDFTVVRSWGSACLANLYHYLCHGCQSGKENVGGAFILVQLWAWERFLYVAPGRKGWHCRPAGSPLGAWYGN
ncbi:hypothetical protein C3L33_22470, partial [Rhododendron williamsianum]